MSLFIDVKYLNQIGNKLSLFKKKDQYTWNCRCPICGDSQKSKHKCRGYLCKGDDSLYYYLSFSAKDHGSGGTVIKLTSKPTSVVLSHTDLTITR
jgi:hypothetical protein